MTYCTLFLNKIIALSFLLFAFATHSVAATIIVSASDSCNYTTIQTGIADAMSGDTVLASAGSYNKNVTIATASDEITVIGAGAATTLIQGASGIDQRIVSLVIDGDTECDVCISGLLLVQI